MARSQSAMEYLMTYGWAILIIAVILGGLYSLGLFNATALSPVAVPGSCRIVRPNGPYTTQFISTSGACNGELPKYVLQLNGQAYLTTSFLSSQSFTVLVWAKSTNSTWNVNGWLASARAADGFVVHPYSGVTTVLGVLYDAAGVIDSSGPSFGATNIQRWHQYGIVYNYTTENSYVIFDGQLVAGPINHGVLTRAANVVVPMCIGCDYGYFLGRAGYGSESNVQLYGTSLDANQIYAQYVAGIGGAPQNLQTLIGWWPLNGDGADYSGNNNQATGSVNAIFTNQWQGGYTVP